MFDSDNTESGDQLDENQESEDQTDGDAEAGQEGDDDQTSDEESDFVEVNGEKLTLEELKRGYMREADYRRKTQQLAEVRNARADSTEDDYSPEERKALEALDKLGVAKKGDVERLVKTMIIQEKIASEKSKIVDEFGVDNDLADAIQFLALRTGTSMEEAAKKFLGKAEIKKKGLSTSGTGSSSKDMKGKIPSIQDISKMDPSSKEFAKVREMMERGEI